MAVPAIDPANTQRYFYDYSIGGDQHTLLVRCTADVGLSDAIVQIDAFLDALDAGMNEIVTVGLRHAEIGSNITNPVDTDGLLPTYGSGVMPVINRPLQVTFTGRSGDGHKAHVGMFGWDAQTDDSWRYTTAENATVTAAVAALTAAGGAGVFCSITGQRVLWHAYMNIGYNDHWIKEARG